MQATGGCSAPANLSLEECNQKAITEDKDFFTYTDGDQCRVCDSFSVKGRAFPQRCYKTCVGGADVANKPANETPPSLPFVEICARSISGTCRPPGRSLEIGDTVYYGYPKDDGVTFDEKK